MFCDRVTEYLQHFHKSTTLNLTQLTVSLINKDAGKKGPVRNRQRTRSPDAMLHVSSPQQFSTTLGYLLAQGNPSFVIKEVSNSGMKLKISAKNDKPPKPMFKETTSTPFELVKIAGNIKKCAGCSGLLKSGPDPHCRSAGWSNLCSS